MRKARKTIVMLMGMIPLLIAGCGSGGGGAVAVKSVAPHTISGVVTLNGAPLSAVAVTIAGGNGSTVVYSGGDGGFTLNNVADGSYTVTPSLKGYSFAPQSQTVVVSGNGGSANFAASAIIGYAISGTVGSANGKGVYGVTVTVSDPAKPGTVAGTATTAGDGSYAVTGLASNPGYLVTVSDAAGDSFTPVSATVPLDQANVQSINFTAAALVTHALSGKVVLDSTGAALAGIELQLQSLSGTIYTTTSDASGNYQLSGIPDGTYGLACQPTPSYVFPPSAKVVLTGADLSGVNVTGSLVNSGGSGLGINF